MWLLRILAVLIMICAALGIALQKKYKKYGIPIWSIIPGIGDKYYKNKSKTELKTSEDGIKYLEPGKDDPEGKKFQSFLRELPKYQIDDGFIASQIRNLMKLAGVEYRQIVLINKADISDKKIWVRKSGHYFINGKGTYFIPWECVKDILYYDLVDSRPLIDKTDDMEWTNQEMCADVVTAVTNTKAMAALQDGELNKLSTYMLYIGIGLLIVAGLTALSIYMDMKANEAILNSLTNISQRI